MNIFQPDNLNESVFTIDIEKLQKRGITNLIIDIEDTIIPKANWKISEEALGWINSLKSKGFNICFLSNTFHVEKAKDLSQKAGVPLITPAFKPFTFGFKRAMKILGSKKENTAVIGDQLFMDILGGNIVGTHTILVKHMTKETNFLRNLMRGLEKRILKN